MSSTRFVTTSTATISKRSFNQIAKAISGTQNGGVIKPTFICYGQQWSCGVRHFSSSPTTRIREFFPEKDSPGIKTTPAAWPHPMYVEQAS